MNKTKCLNLEYLDRCDNESLKYEISLIAEEI